MASNSITNSTLSGSITIGSIYQGASTESQQISALAHEIRQLINANSCIPEEQREMLLRSLTFTDDDPKPIKAGLVRRTIETILEHAPAAASLVQKLQSLLEMVS